MNPIIIDVREKDEFDAEYIESAIHLPLSTFEHQAPALFQTLRGRQIILMCRSGRRASLAAQQASRFCEDLQLEIFPGGILEWKKQGKPTLAKKGSHLPIMRQVQLIAGSFVVIGAVLAYFINPAFILLPGFMGAGLAFAGATGFCGMAEILARMPWNKGLSKNACGV